MNAARYDGLTALMAGCGQTNAELVKALLAKGANPNAQDTRGVTACHMAAEVGALDVVTALVPAGADCTIMAAQAAITPLIVAAAAGEEEMVSLLLAITTDVRAQRIEGREKLEVPTASWLDAACSVPPPTHRVCSLPPTCGGVRADCGGVALWRCDIATLRWCDVGRWMLFTLTSPR